MIYQNPALKLQKLYQIQTVKKNLILMIKLSQIPLFLLVLIASIAKKSTSNSIINPFKVKTISWKPRAFVYEGFLTDEECNHLISLAKSELKRSAVADNESGKSTLSEVRTSSGMFISKAKDPIVAGIEDKIATWTFLPKGHIFQ
ncbi:hypothetical protein ABFX02_07G022500 [Erythranthe guttata]